MAPEGVNEEIPEANESAEDSASPKRKGILDIPLKGDGSFQIKLSPTDEDNLEPPEVVKLGKVETAHFNEEDKVEAQDLVPEIDLKANDLKPPLPKIPENQTESGSDSKYRQTFGISFPSTEKDAQNLEGSKDGVIEEEHGFHRKATQDIRNITTPNLEPLVGKLVMSSIRVHLDNAGYDSDDSSKPQPQLSVKYNANEKLSLTMGSKGWLHLMIRFRKITEVTIKQEAS